MSSTPIPNIAPWLAVSDGQKAVAAPMSEGYGWRTGRVTDPFGHDWEMSKQLTS